MSRKYIAADFTNEKPRICVHRRAFGGAEYVYQCKGPAGSLGYGSTPAEAFRSWRSNYLRRAKFYLMREEEAARWVAMSVRARTASAKP